MSHILCDEMLLECEHLSRFYELSRHLRSSTSPKTTARPEPTPMPMAILLSAIPIAMPTATPMMIPRGNVPFDEAFVMDSV